ncbi:hypothetical protein F5B20DRAFT_597651 [Whalleya microplaca]|nr:hypothetical protein F5B20DRAFT_597651 [Whalleya microplaca]
MAPWLHAMSPEHSGSSDDTIDIRDLNHNGFLENDPYEAHPESSTNTEADKIRRMNDTSTSTQVYQTIRTTESREVDVRVRAQPDSVSPDGTLTLSLDGAILEEIINSIDIGHCFKFRWYIARHLRQNYSCRIRPSQQTYYHHLLKGHNFSKKDNGGWTLNRLCPTPFKRLDFEAVRAQLRGAPAWKHERIFLVIEEALQAYGWDEIVNDDTVDDVLKADAVNPLLFERLKPQTAATSPVVSPDTPYPDLRVTTTSSAFVEASNRTEPPALGSDVNEVKEENDGFPTVETPENPCGDKREDRDKSESEGSVKKLRNEEEKPKKKTSIELFREAMKEAKGVEEKQEKPRRAKQDRRAGKETKEARKASKKQKRREEKKAQLNALHREYMKDLDQLTRKYHRKRLAIEQSSGL